MLFLLDGIEHKTYDPPRHACHIFLFTDRNTPQVSHFGEEGIASLDVDVASSGALSIREVGEGSGRDRNSAEFAGVDLISNQAVFPQGIFY